MDAPAPISLLPIIQPAITSMVSIPAAGVTLHA
jgi:hypothetical protein